MSVKVTRTEHSAADLRRLASQVKDANQVRRMLAIAFVLDGWGRSEAAQACGMDRQTLCDWVHRYNAHGVEGLSDLPSPGRKPSLTSEQEAAFADIVRKGPSRAEHGVVRWRRADLRDVIKTKFGVSFHERSVGKLLDKLGFSHISVRPRHPHSDPETQAAFKKTSPLW
jgi:transposase